MNNTIKYVAGAVVAVLIGVGLGFALDRPVTKVKTVPEIETVVETVEVEKMSAVCEAALNGLFQAVRDYNNYAVDILEKWKNYIATSGYSGVGSFNTPQIQTALDNYSACYPIN